VVNSITFKIKLLELSKVNNLVNYLGIGLIIQFRYNFVIVLWNSYRAKFNEEARAMYFAASSNGAVAVTRR